MHAATAAWGKSTSTVYYAAVDSTGRSGIWSVAIGGGTPRILFRDDPKHRLGQLRFATNDKRLFITIAADESDVFVMELKKP